MKRSRHGDKTRWRGPRTPRTSHAARGRGLRAEVRGIGAHLHPAPATVRGVSAGRRGESAGPEPGRTRITGPPCAAPLGLLSASPSICCYSSPCLSSSDPLQRLLAACCGPSAALDVPRCAQPRPAAPAPPAIAPAPSSSPPRGAPPNPAPRVPNTPLTQKPPRMRRRCCPCRARLQHAGCTSLSPELLRPARHCAARTATTPSGAATAASRCLLFLRPGPAAGPRRPRAWATHSRRRPSWPVVIPSAPLAAGHGPPWPAVARGVLLPPRTRIRAAPHPTRAAAFHPPGVLGIKTGSREKKCRARSTAR